MDRHYYFYHNNNVDTNASNVRDIIGHLNTLDIYCERFVSTE